MRISVFDAPIGRVYDASGSLVQEYTMPEELIDKVSGDGSLAVLPTSDDASIRILSPERDQAFLLDLDGQSAWSSENSYSFHEMAARDPRGRPVHPEFDRPAWPSMDFGLLRWSSELGEIDVEHVTLFLYGARLEAGGNIYSSGEKDALSPAPQPFVPQYLHRYFIVVELWGAVLSLEGSADAWRVMSAGFEGSLAGDLELVHAHGQLVVGGTEQALRTNLTHILGSYNASVDFHNGRSDWRLEGVATVIGIDGLPLVDSRNRFDAALVAGAGLLGVWLLLEALLRLAGLRGRSQVLEHAARVAMLRELVHSPGASAMQLAQAAGVGRATARHHLHRLKVAGLVAKFGNGRIPSYALNGTSRQFRVGEDDVPAADIFACLQHPARRRILDATKDKALDYGEYREWAASNGGGTMAAGTFTRHCQQLQQVGLLRRFLNKGRVLWQTRISLLEIHDHYIRSFLLEQGWWEAFKELSSTSPSNAITMGDDGNPQAILQALGLLGKSRQGGSAAKTSTETEGRLQPRPRAKELFDIAVQQ